MHIFGHGIDIVSVPRIAAMLDRHAERFVERVFTPGEAAYCRSSPRRAVEHFAARFAAKEAAMKCLGTGWTRGVSWNEFEVVREASGMPGLIVRGVAGRIALERGIDAWRISLSHTDEYAVASVIACGRAS